MRKAAFISAVLLAFASFGAEAQSLTKMDVGSSGSTSFVNLACVVAKQGGFFEKHGLDVTFVESNGGSRAAAAVLSGDVGITCTGGSYAINAARQGQSLKFVLPILNQLTMSFTVANDAIEKAGITPDTPANEVMKKLKGITIGSSNPGGSADTFLRYLIKFNGLNPDTDFNILPLGSDMANILATFDRGLIKAGAYSSPFPEYVEQKGAGKVVVSLMRGDIKELAGTYYCGLLVNERFAQANPKLIQGVVSGVADAMLFIHSDTAKARDLAAQYIKPSDRKMFDAAFDAMVKAIPSKIELLQWDGFEKLLRYQEQAEGRPGPAVTFDQVARNDFIQAYLAAN